MTSKGKRGKARIGRPPVPAADRRGTLVRVLTTKAEHAELRRAAAEAGLSVSTWVSAVALEKARGGSR